MKKKQLHLVSLFHFNSNIAGKDMFLVPMYLGQHLGASVEFVYPKADFNKDFVGEYRGVKLTPIKSKSQYYSTFWSEKEMLWWLICNARQIDVLSLFWLNPRNVIFAWIYKLINPCGVCYIKGDISNVAASKRWKWRIKEFFYRAVDILSVETEDIYNKIRQKTLGKHLAHVVVLMSNGFDIEMYEKTGIKRKSYAQKENLILTVGRIGHPDKNNEMMFKAIDGLDLLDWKFFLVGPVEDSFRIFFNDFIIRNEDKRNQVFLMGEICDRKELWEIFNRSKIFLLTSPKECMAQVYSEALAFGNYIITTDVQGAKEITDNQRLGKIIGLNDVQILRQTIKDIIYKSMDISEIANEATKLSNEKYNWRNLTQEVALQIKFIYDTKNS